MWKCDFDIPEAEQVLRQFGRKTRMVSEKMKKTELDVNKNRCTDGMGDSVSKLIHDTLSRNPVL